MGQDAKIKFISYSKSVVVNFEYDDGAKYNLIDSACEFAEALKYAMLRFVIIVFYFIFVIFTLENMKVFHKYLYLFCPLNNKK